MKFTKIKLFEGMGRGIVATRNINLARYTIMECEVLVLDACDTMIVNDTELKHYTFKYSDFRDCLVLGDGEIFNHSDTPNVGYRLVNFIENGEIRKKMKFFLLRPVKLGEQLFIDYNADVKVNMQEYLDSKPMME
jgi:hypothetical protein